MKLQKGLPSDNCTNVKEMAGQEDASMVKELFPTIQPEEYEMENRETRRMHGNRERIRRMHNGNGYAHGNKVIFQMDTLPDRRRTKGTALAASNPTATSTTAQAAKRWYSRRRRIGGAAIEEESRGNRRSSNEGVVSRET